MYLRQGAAAIMILLGCTFNVDEDESRRWWIFNTNGVGRVILDRALMEENAVSVMGEDADTLIVEAVAKGLVLEEDAASLDDLKLTCTKSGGDARLVFAFAGEHLPGLRLEEVIIKMTRSLDLDVSTEDGDVSVDGMEGYVTVTNSGGAIDVETKRGCRIDSKTGDVRIDICESDTLFESIEVSVTRADVTICVPSDLRARLDLQTERGEISVPAGSTSSSLNGGGSGDPTISCTTTTGDIIINAD